jgi:DNA-binding transcriptional MerR regulator
MDAGEMKNRDYTIGEIARLAGVGIKTLHHYDAIGLLRPAGRSEARYRLYGRPELERLQEILLLRALGFRLSDVRDAISGSGNRLALLEKQRQLTCRRQRELERLLAQLDRTIRSERGDETMTDEQLFQGLPDAHSWQSALKEHNEHLEQDYGFTPPPVTDAEAMNDMAKEATSFTRAMIDALKSKKAPGDDVVKRRITEHLAFMGRNGQPTDAQGFIARTEFFLADSFHREMLEGQQLGLTYYLAAAARAFAQ